MRAELPPAIVVTPDGEGVSSLDVQKGNHQRLRVETDSGSGDVALNFSTRRAMYDFAVSRSGGRIRNKWAARVLPTRYRRQLDGREWCEDERR
jgi:hypothetical protein